MHRDVEEVLRMEFRHGVPTIFEGHWSETTRTSIASYSDRERTLGLRIDHESSRKDDTRLGVIAYVG
jgi:hypothetical protein